MLSRALRQGVEQSSEVGRIDCSLDGGTIVYIADWLEERYTCLKLISPITSSRARDGGWQMPYSYYRTWLAFCLCYRPNGSLVRRIRRYTSGLV